MTIKNLTEQLRMPRLGKLHLGYRDEKKKGAPTATDYFVCPDEVKKVYGDKPKQLPIMIPTEDSEYWASQYYRAYSQTRGLICRGDGEIYHRMVDIETKEIASKDTKNVAWVDGVCAGQDCPIYQDKKCNEMMCLQFMLPDVPGVGVWQVDTGSINSIRNINSEAHLIRRLCGHISMLPLFLTLEPEEKQIPETGKKRQLYFLHLRERGTLQSLLRDSQKPVFELLAPPVDEAQAARDIEAYWGDGKVEPTEATTPSSTPADAISKGIKSEGSGNLSEGGEEGVKTGNRIDPVWLKETLEIINWHREDYKTARSWISSQLKAPVEGTIAEVVNSLDDKQLKIFSEHIGTMRESAGK